MKLNRNLISAVGLLAAAMGTQAAQISTFDWQFTNDSRNQSVPPTTSVSPSGAEALLNIAAGGEGYQAGATYGDSGSFGSPTGVWAIGGSGSIQLDLNAYTANPGTPLTYTLSIYEFVGSSAAGTDQLFPGSPTFSLLGGTRTGHELQAGKSGSLGDWYKETYTWSVTPDANSKLSLTIYPKDNFSPLFVDQMQFRVDGDLSLVAVPEPVLATSLTAAGLALFGFYRRNKKA